LSNSEEDQDSISDKPQPKISKSKTDWRQLLQNPDEELPETSEQSQGEEWDNDHPKYEEMGITRTLWNVMDYFQRNKGLTFSYITKDLLPERWQEVQGAITAEQIEHVFLFDEYYLCSFNSDSPLTWGEDHLWWDAMITYVNEGDKPIWFGIGKGAMIPFVSYVGDKNLQISVHEAILDKLPLVAWVTNSNRHPFALVYVPDEMRTSNPKNLPAAALRLVSTNDIFWERLYTEKTTYASMEFIPWRDIDDNVRKRNAGPKGIKKGITEGIKFKYLPPKAWNRLQRQYGVATPTEIDVDKEMELRSVSNTEHILPIATEEVVLNTVYIPLSLISSYVLQGDRDFTAFDILTAKVPGLQEIQYVREDKNHVPPQKTNVPKKGTSKRFSWKDQDPSKLQGDELKRYRDAQRKALSRQLKGSVARKGYRNAIVPSRTKRMSRPIEPAQGKANSKPITTRGSTSRPRQVVSESSSSLSACPEMGHADKLSHVDNQTNHESSIIPSDETIKIHSNAIADRLEQRFQDQLQFKLDLKDELEKLQETILEQRVDTFDKHEEVIKPIEVEMRDTLTECKQVLKRLKALEIAQERLSQQLYEDVVTKLDQQHKKFEKRVLGKIIEMQSRSLNLDEFLGYFARMRAAGWVPVAETSIPQGMYRIDESIGT